MVKAWQNNLIHSEVKTEVKVGGIVTEQNRNNLKHLRMWK